MPNLVLHSEDRVFICGKTGSGKTFLARHITRTLPRFVVLDGKGTLGDWGLLPWEDRQVQRDLREGKPVRARALPPSGEDPEYYWDEVLATCYAVGNITIYIDEMYAVVPPNRQASPTLWACYTRGREFGVGVWASTQRPVWVPLVALSEAEHFFMFRLTLAEDRDRLAAFMGPDVVYPIRDKHGFFYSMAEWDEPEYYQKLQVSKQTEVN